MRGALFVYATGYIAVELMLLRRRLSEAIVSYEATKRYADKLLIQKLGRHVVKNEDLLEKVRCRMETAAEAQRFRRLKRRRIYDVERIGKLQKV